jgi:Rod binding domain-containing protein
MPVEPVLPGALTAGLEIGGSLSAKDSPGKIREAASQFEALLISQVLKASRSDDEEGWLGTGEDQTAGSLMSLAEDYFARAMAARGGFGLARMVAAGLERRISGEPTNSSSPELSPEAAAAQYKDD